MIVLHAAERGRLMKRNVREKLTEVLLLIAYARRRPRDITVFSIQVNKVRHKCAI